MPCSPSPTQTSEVHTVKLLMGQPELLLYNMLDNTTCHINEGVCAQIKWTEKFNFTNNSLILRHFRRDDNQIPHINREAWGSTNHENWRLWITFLSSLYHWSAHAKDFLKNLLRGTWFGLRKRSQRLLPSLSENDDVQVTNKSDTSNSGPLPLTNCTVNPEATNQ